MRIKRFAFWALLGLFIASNLLALTPKYYHRDKDTRLEFERVYRSFGQEVGARAYLSADQLNIVDATWTKILLDTETYDLGGDFASYKFVAPVSGYYQINASILWDNLVADKQYITGIWVNGTVVLYGRSHSSHGGYMTCQISDILYLTKDDYVELYCYHSTGVSTEDIKGSSVYTFMSVFLILRD